jgi:hypothetical protein
LRRTVSPYKLYNLMVVGEQREMARRIAAVRMRDDRLFDRLPKKRKIIRFE